MRNLLLSAFALVCLLPMNAQTVNTRIYPAEKLAKVKAKADTPTYAPAIKTLMKEADKAMNLTPPSVMDKSMTASSGDKHDYMSMGPYWWPDPSKPDGLPYIRKDGLRNPELSKLDRDRLGNMAKAVTTLGIAYYFSGNEQYAKKATDFLKVWFLDAKTKMNPNLNYGQTIPGRRDGLGRGTGMIDTYCFGEMLDALTLLDSSKAMTPAIKKGMKEWFTQFVEWIQTSPVAAEENAAKNNHGLAYDVQLTAYALYIGNKELAIQILKEFPAKRLFSQIEPDGKQPLELERTTAFGYTLFNLTHMLDMSFIGATEGIDIYNAASEDGRSITAALKFTIPYIGKPQSEWPYQQIKEWDKKQDEACWVLRKASFFDPKAGYEAIGAKYRTTSASSRLNLMYSLE